MEKLLDKEVHQMYKAPASSVYYSSSASSSNSNTQQQSSNSTVASSTSEDKGGHEEGATTKDGGEEGDTHEENDAATTDPRRGDHPTNGNRPRSLPSAGAGQNGAPSSSRMRDLRQAHRWVVEIDFEVVLLCWIVITVVDQLTVNCSPVVIMF